MYVATHLAGGPIGPPGKCQVTMQPSPPLVTVTVVLTKEKDTFADSVYNLQSVAEAKP